MRWRATEIAGSTTNLAFLSALAGDPDFAAGDVDTGLIARKQDALTAAPAPDERIVAQAVLAAARSSERGTGGPGRSLGVDLGLCAFPPLARQVTLAHGEDRIAAAVTVRADGRADILLAGREQPQTIDLAEPVRTALWPGHVSVFAAAQSYSFASPTRSQRVEEAASHADTLRAPMPGLVKIVRAAKGEAVTQGPAAAGAGSHEDGAHDRRAARRGARRDRRRGRAGDRRDGAGAVRRERWQRPSLKELLIASQDLWQAIEYVGASRSRCKSRPRRLLTIASVPPNSPHPFRLTGCLFRNSMEP